MNDENESAAFCFRCPVKAPYTDPAILQPLYNPFPQLVRSDNLDYAHTQPLIHASYLPPPLLRPPGTTLLLKTRADFLNHFIRMHEVIHLQGLDRTPAKELARTALAFQYAYLHELMSKKPYQQTQNAWNEFNANEKTLRDIAKDILFVEELLATLIAHESIMYYQDHSDVYEVSDNLQKRFEEEATSLEKDVLQNQEKNFPGFQEAYGILQSNKLLEISDDSLPTLIIAFQPLKVVDNVIKTVDTRENLYQIFTIFDVAADTEETIRNLQHFSEESSATWQRLLQANFNHAYHLDSQVTDIMFHYGEFIRMLWIISHGEFKTNLAPNTPEDYVAQVMARDPFDASLRFVSLMHGMHRGQRYIHQTWTATDEEKLNVEVAPNTEYGILLFFESIRQQITARKGIICPFNKGTRKCNCSKEIRSQLLRLSHLAVDGLFGEGDWFLLPCRR